MRSRMAGRSFLYCSPSFTVATRLFPAMIASGDGVCADAAKVKQRKLPTMINKRLHMENSTEMWFQTIAGLLNSLDHGFFGVERGLGGLCHANKQVAHFRGAAQKPGYADHDQNARGTDGQLLAVKHVNTSQAAGTIKAAFDQTHFEYFAISPRPHQAANTNMSCQQNGLKYHVVPGG